MKRITKSVLAYMSLGMIVLTWALAEALSWYQLQEISSALVMTVAIIGMQQWFRPAMRSLRDGQEGSDFLALAIFINLFTIGFQRVWINILRWLGRPDWLVYSPLLPLFLLLFTGLYLFALPYAAGRSRQRQGG